jgi:hypothetical protein
VATEPERVSSARQLKTLKKGEAEIILDYSGLTTEGPVIARQEKIIVNYGMMINCEVDQWI